MPSTQSLWMDEAQTWRIAIKPSVAALVADLRETQASEGLMPLGMLSAWAALRVFGESEWQLRAVNIVWAAVATGAFFVLGRRWRIPWAPLFLAIQPFLWFYANEARPYTLQIAAGAWLLVSLVIAVEDRRLDWPNLLILIVSSATLIATTLFGVLTAGPVFLVLGWLGWRERWSLPRRWSLGAAVLLLWILTFGAYYLQTVARGAAGARLWDVGFSNIAFAFYEFAGFSGLSPSRNEIRELAQTGGARAILNALTPACLAAVGTLAFTYLLLLRAFRPAVGGPDRRTLGAIGIVAFASCASLVLLALAARFPFWGRHLAPVFPFFCAVTILAIRSLGVARGGWGRWVGPVLAVLLAISAGLLRTQPRHAKDDYRAAVAIAQRTVEENGVVWWCADPDTARYYALPVSREHRSQGPIVFVSGYSPEELVALTPPNLIVLSKPDIFDPKQSLLDYVNQRGYQLQESVNAFRIFSPARR